ncbi:MAG: SelB C-terminal domain-containing protein, partial [Planctomycetota bacterium]
SPMITLGGGTIVAESIRRLGRGRKDAIDAVRAKLGALRDLPAYLSLLLLERQAQPMQGSDIPIALKCPAEEAARLLDLLRDRGEAVELGRGRWIHRVVFDAGQERLVACLEQFHAENRLRASCEVLELRKRTGMEGPLLEGLLKRLEASGRIAAHRGGRVALAGFEPQLDSQETAVRERLGERLESAGLTPPSLADLVQECGVPKETVEALLRLMVEQGELKRTGEIHFAASQVERALGILKTVAREAGGEILVPKLRDAMGTTRKYLIPLLEHFDSSGLTVRRGERRFFVEQASESAG